MSDYIREYSAGELVSASVSIYKQHFRVLFLVYILPTIPAMVLSTSIKHIDPTNPALLLTSFVVQAIIGLIAAAPITVAVSDICLGNQPNLRRSYLRPIVVVGKLAGTSLLVFLITMVGLLLLYIPGVVAGVMLMFAITVVVIERLGPVASMRRSVFLGKGSYWRNFGVLMLMSTFVLVPIMMIAFWQGFILAAYSESTMLEPWLEHLINVYSLIFAPLLYITVVLLYYDMRVRKENYDATALAQDFMG